MASKKHQFILGLIVKKIREDGFSIISIDGKMAGSFGLKLDLPPKILRHRPDVIAIDESGRICIGEAKTKNDILNKRTAEQLVDYTSISLNEKSCYVILGISQDSKDEMDKLLTRIGLHRHESIFVIQVPNIIINE